MTLELPAAEGGGLLTIERIISAEELRGTPVGGRIYIQLDEHQLFGYAKVLSLEPCPALAEGPGRLVVARFRQVSPEVLDLWHDGAAAPLTVTASHPLWSVEEASYLQAGRLRPGTHLLRHDVTGFDATDVTVTAGTKGIFTAVSASSYTLAVTGTGGTVTASVGAAAASAASGFGGVNAAATPYSNFYQDTWTITLPGSVPMELIRIPAGTFAMGSPSGELSRLSDETQHTVTLSQDFYLGKTEVTQAQWLAIYGSFPSGGQDNGTGAGNETRAVHRVSHGDITNASTGFMKLLNDHVTEPGTFSLPTESQWEYAARAGTTTRFNFGNGLSADETCGTGGGREANMWYCGNSSNSTQLVGQKPANAWGLRDMHGNLWEFCSDWYDATYPGTVTDPTGPVSGSNRVIRGGSWSGLSQDSRSARRSNLDATFRVNFSGFRVLAVR